MIIKYLIGIFAWKIFQNESIYENNYSLHTLTNFIQQLIHSHLYIRILHDRYNLLATKVLIIIIIIIIHIFIYFFHELKSSNFETKVCRIVISVICGIIQWPQFSSNDFYITVWLKTRQQVTRIITIQVKGIMYILY